MRTILGFYFLCFAALSICQSSSKPKAQTPAMNLKKQVQKTKEGGDLERVIKHSNLFF
jgi:hypothetical protein